MENFNEAFIDQIGELWVFLLGFTAGIAGLLILVAVMWLGIICLLGMFAEVGRQITELIVPKKEEINEQEKVPETDKEKV